MAAKKALLLVIFAVVATTGTRADFWNETVFSTAKERYESPLWNSNPVSEDFNCPGYVADEVCCQVMCLLKLLVFYRQPEPFFPFQSNHCSSAKNVQECRDPSRKLYCEWKKQACVNLRDVSNNVCCKEQPPNGCHEIVNLRCPKDWQVHPSKTHF